MKIGYKLIAEAYSPVEMVRQCVRAEEAGFDFVEISDHYHPWVSEQQHSGFAWSMLAAMAARTERIELATGVTCPMIRYHPAVIAQAAAIASLEAKDELDVRVKEIVAERERVLAALAEAGWQMTPSQANFVWFPLGERTADFVAACTEAGLSVRPYGSDGVRVTIGETEANDRLIEVAREFLRAAS